MNFSDTCEAVLDNENPYPLSQQRATKLLSLIKMIREYDEKLPCSDPLDSELEEVLNDPKWIEITEYAKKVYDELRDSA